MDEMSPALAFSSQPSSASCDPASVEVTCPKRIAEEKDVVVDSMESAATDLAAGLEQIESTAQTSLEEDGDMDTDDLETRTIPGSDEEDLTSIDPELSAGSSCSVIIDGSSVPELSSDSSYDLGTPTSADAGNNLGKIVPVRVLEELSDNPLNDHSAGRPTAESEATGKKLSGSSKGSRNVYLRESLPLWGCVTICGRRPEMEDAVVVVPKFFEVPLRAVIGDQVLDGLDPDTIRVSLNFFGVYDGHGGAQVANYCRERLHHVLTELLTDLVNNIGGKSCSDWKKLWEKSFVVCFQNIDDEVGGKESNRTMGSTVDTFNEDDHHYSRALSEPIAPETVGSTAVVAVVCPTQIIVANCGDSRAVLCRGKQPIPLSVDHKPNREDEYLRIESQGGKVIHWNGYRVFGVLAMSRSIGDRYLKPWIIPEPEVTITPRVREDECLILASDGLWDVMSNEEVCDVARKQILLWHKRNGPVSPSSQSGTAADPAAQAAADCLMRLASQKGSKDNITIIVVDLKAQRKFKSRS
ncbi:protein phosphatase 2C 50-like [Zingiber officinale]|uniref:protein-serine/threonine phosphatase n=1 Tax=Zingiber officinale TaxID=94328 RepID=A0A8J5HBX9_ZINOF|nr:protein phosphatase 2C 50-like [Zingiber officinale]XP_042462775.1 protein phosphatase 2C 50-like [Zingiber officinale]KAG6524691.1 hypothetical protein ZIOFF_014626 [Zingiber officinale]